MVSFSFKDVIFLFNKWDILSDEDENMIEEYFEKLRKILYKYWEELDDLCIFKIFVIKVIYLFFCF